MFIVEAHGGQYEDRWHTTIAVCPSLIDARNAINDYVKRKIAEGYQHCIEYGYNYFSDDMDYANGFTIRELKYGTVEDGCDTIVERHRAKWPNDIDMEITMHDYHNLVNDQQNMDMYLLQPITQGEWIQLQFDLKVDE